MTYADTQLHMDNSGTASWGPFLSLQVWNAPSSPQYTTASSSVTSQASFSSSLK